MASKVTMEWFLRTAGVLILIGLLIETLTLWWARPVAFLVFAFVGVPIVFAGILCFLYSLVSVSGAIQKEQ
jgi:hypothetical protein